MILVGAILFGAGILWLYTCAFVFEWIPPPNIGENFETAPINWKTEWLRAPAVISLGLLLTVAGILTVLNNLNGLR